MRTAGQAIRLPLILATIVATATPSHAAVNFNRDIRPIMSDTCFRCHGPDKNARIVGLRLDLREEALKPAIDGKVPIVPGKPEQSEIITRIFSSDPRHVMPPAFSHKTLTQA